MTRTARIFHNSKQVFEQCERTKRLRNIDGAPVECTRRAAAHDITSHVTCYPPGQHWRLDPARRSPLLPPLPSQLRFAKVQRRNGGRTKCQYCIYQSAAVSDRSGQPRQKAAHIKPVRTARKTRQSQHRRIPPTLPLRKHEIRTPNKNEATASDMVPRQPI